MRCFSVRILAALLMLFGATFASFSAHAGETDVRQCIQSLGDQALATVRNTTLSKEQKRQALENLFLTGTDTEWMGRFVLGIYWRRVDDAQKAQYLDLYRQLLLKNYTARFEEYTGTTFDILGATASSKPGEYVVQTRIVRVGQEPVTVDYRVREAVGGAPCKVFDIVVEGVSLIATQRSEYTSFTGRNGIDGLIDELRQRLATPVSSNAGGSRLPVVRS